MENNAMWLISKVKNTSYLPQIESFGKFKGGGKGG